MIDHEGSVDRIKSKFNNAKRELEELHWAVDSDTLEEALQCLNALELQLDDWKYCKNIPGHVNNTE